MTQPLSESLSSDLQTDRVSPRRLFRAVAVAEASTWALLLFGMVLKYVTHTTELGVRVFGMAHGVVFVAYCVITVLVAIDAQWRPARLLLSLLAAIPPFATLLAEWSAERAQALGECWRLRRQRPGRGWERLPAWLIAQPGRGAVVLLVVVAALTCLALLVGPPMS